MNAYKQLHLSGLSLILCALMPLGAAQAQVAVTSADPPEAPQGTISLDVTINGSGFDSSATVDFLVTGTTNPGGIIVKKVVAKGTRKLIATIDVADTAVVDKFDIAVTLSGGRKGKGTSLFAVLAKTNDPCMALNIDFPAFTFARLTPSGRQIYLADATGQCIRPLLELTGSISLSGASRPAFSYPVAGTTNVGRLAWTSNDNVEVTNLIHVFTFQVTGTSITSGTLQLIYDSYPNGIFAMNLSQDGTTAYFNLTSYPNNGSPRIMSINVDSGNVQQLFAGLPDGAFINRIYSNEDGTLFVRLDSSDLGLPNKLLRIGSSCNNPACAIVLAESPTGAYGVDFPAPSLVDNRLAYLEQLVPYSTGCRLLQIIPDTGGPILNSAQPRYGRGALSWYGNKLLTNGYKSPTRQGRCDSTGMITQIDPDTSAETALVRGYDPDGR